MNEVNLKFKIEKVLMPANEIRRLLAPKYRNFLLAHEFLHNIERNITHQIDEDLLTAYGETTNPAPFHNV